MIQQICTSNLTEKSLLHKHYSSYHKNNNSSLYYSSLYNIRGLYPLQTHRMHTPQDNDYCTATDAYQDIFKKQLLIQSPKMK